MLTTLVSEATENLLTLFRIFISWLFCNQEEIGCGGQGYCYGTQFLVCTTVTAYTKRCTNTRRVCWCKFGRNPTKSFWVICILICLSLVPRQGFFLDFACLSIYIFDTSPELFVCLSIYEDAETCPPRDAGFLSPPTTTSLTTGDDTHVVQENAWRERASIKDRNSFQWELQQ